MTYEIKKACAQESGDMLINMHKLFSHTEKMYILIAEIIQKGHY